jgi:hypothetical protein
LQQLSAGDAHCPNGGTSISVGGTTTYACNGSSGSSGGSIGSGGNAFVPQSGQIGNGTLATLGTTPLNGPAFVSFTGSIVLAPNQAGIVDNDYLTLTVKCALVLSDGSQDFELSFVEAGTGPNTSSSIEPISLTAYSGGAGTLELQCQQVSANNGGHFLLAGGGRFSWMYGS